MLTRKQHELLMLIHDRLKETGVPPSFEEMKEALDLRSKSGIHRLITALEERGFIRRLPHRARALEVIKLPEAAAGPGGSGGDEGPAGRPAPPRPVQTVVRSEPKVGRNDPCPCGSGKKYKKCCGR